LLPVAHSLQARAGRNQIDDAKVGTSLMEVYDSTNNERTHEIAKEAMKLLLQ
jgi:hypothetical protein